MAKPVWVRNLLRFAAGSGIILLIIAASVFLTNEQKQTAGIIFLGMALIYVYDNLKQKIGLNASVSRQFQEELIPNLTVTDRLSPSLEERWT